MDGTNLCLLPKMNSNKSGDNVIKNVIRHEINWTLNVNLDRDLQWIISAPHLWLEPLGKQ